MTFLLKAMTGCVLQGWQVMGLGNFGSRPLCPSCAHTGRSSGAISGNALCRCSGQLSFLAFERFQTALLATKTRFHGISNHQHALENGLRVLEMALGMQKRNFV